MFDANSRYYTLETATITDTEGHTLAYKRRRFLPAGESLPLLAEITVTQGDRLDVITARTLGDPEQFWRVCDANNTLHPLDLTETVGAVLRVPMPQG